MRSRPRFPRSSNRGALLIVAMLLSAAIAISLGSFINLATQTSQLSYRGFYAGSAMNAAETGLEQGMWAINKRLAGNTDVWRAAGWTTLDTGAVRCTLDLGTLSGGATAQAKVYVSSANLIGTSPFLIARSIITPKKGPQIERWIKITLSKRSRFSTGLVAKDSISFSGNNASVDSYDSRLGAYNASLSGGTGNNRYDRGTAGSASVTVDSVRVNQADIWGFAVVGTSDRSGLNVGTQGLVGPFGTSAGTVAADHVLTDFTANFDDVAHPATYTGAGAYNITSITDAMTLPRAAVPAVTVKIKGVDVTTPAIAADVPTTVTTTVNGVSTTKNVYYYNIGSISLSGNDSKLTIADNVVIRMTGSTGSAISVTGQGSIVIDAPSTGKKPALELFTEADISISGNGITNNGGNPANLKIWGTRASDRTNQSLTINGNGVLSAVVYAPNADIAMHGGGNSGNVYGSMVGETITVTGNSAFHYDEALADLDSGEPMGMSKWTEYVTYADRAGNASYVTW